MTNPLENLEPSNLWRYFAEISAIPRESGNETKAVDYIEKVAREKGLEYHRDSTGNILVRIPAASGYESAPVVVLQGHIDMVCVKEPEHAHDFRKDGINLIIDGDWVRADNTTLGADNGIGVAAALAMIDEKDAIHPPLEILVTVDEETGMSGAMNIHASMVKGRTLINLDSENPEIIYVGCAGGGDTVIKLKTPREPIKDGIALKIRISGLSGGHSGMDIIRHRANAIKLLARILYSAESLTPRISTITGGVRRNVIPSDAESVIVLKKRSLGKFKKVVEEIERQTREEFGGNDPNMKFDLSVLDEKPSDIIKAGASRDLIRLITALPYGILAMSREIQDLVETSNNVGVLRDHGEYVELVATTRSSVDSAKLRVQDEIASTCALAKAKWHHEHQYPGWKPNLESPILKLAREVYVGMFGREPRIVAIHAGLETGFFSERFSTSNMISFGPKIDGAHSTQEKVNIPSVIEFFGFLKAVLERVAKNQDSNVMNHDVSKNQ